MKNKINELQVPNPPQPPLTNDTQSFVRQSLIKGGGKLASKKVGGVNIIPSLLKGRLGWVNSIKAFTLAEVLITLGIIGIVAALTLPTLIQNYQKQVYVNQLKKSYSTISQAIQKAMADEGVTNTKEMNSFIKTENNQYVYDIEEMKKYLNIIEVDDWSKYGRFYASYKTLNKLTVETTNYIFMELTLGKLNVGKMLFLNDGSIIYLPTSWGTTSNTVIGGLGIDVNGQKGPNLSGRDLFFFSISEDGQLHPFGGSRIEIDSAPDGHVIEYGTGSGYLVNRGGGLPSSAHRYCNSNPSSNLGDGRDCAARIMYNGWVMDY